MLLTVREDITKVDTVTAIVNAANTSLLGGVDGPFTGRQENSFWRNAGYFTACRTGKAKITGAYKLPCKYVIHTAGPVWRGGNYGEPELLTDCYRNKIPERKRGGIMCG